MRPIEIESFEAVQAEGDPGAAPMLQWLATADLVVDDAYQRPINKVGRKSIVAIAERFDWSKFAPVVVSPVEGGRYAIVDGQHRATAARLRGLETLPCMIVVADRARQAASFRAINGQVTKVTALQIHRAAVAAGDPDALQIDATCKAAGVRLVTNAAISQRNHLDAGAVDMLSSVVGIRKLIGQYGADEAVLTLKAIVSATVTGSPLKGAVMSAVASTFHRYDEWRAEESRLLAIMAETDLNEIVIRGRQEAIRRRGVDVATLIEGELVKHLERAFRRAA